MRSPPTKKRKNTLNAFLASSTRIQGNYSNAFSAFCVPSNTQRKRPQPSKEENAAPSHVGYSSSHYGLIQVTHSGLVNPKLFALHSHAYSKSAHRIWYKNEEYLPSFNLDREYLITN